MNALGIALLWCVVQVTLTALPVAGLYLVVRRLRPAAAAPVLLTGLGVVVALSLLTLSPWPKWTFHTFSPLPLGEGPGVRAKEYDSDPFLADFASAPDAAPAASEGIDWSAAAEKSPSDAGSIVQSFLNDLVGEHAAATVGRRWPAVAAMLLPAATLCGLAWMLLGVAAVRRRLLRSRPVLDRELLELVDVLCAELGCRRQIEVRQADGLATAATVGWRRPVLLLPDDWTSWTAGQRRAVLAHEIAHVRGCDFIALLVGHFGLSLHFYHPLLHWLVGRLRLEQELSADAAAAGVSGGGRNYLTTIAELALRRQERPLFWPARSFLPTQTTFLRRIAMLRDSRLRTDRLSPAARVLCVSVVLLCGLAAAGFRGPASHQQALAAEAAESDGGGFVEEQSRAAEAGNFWAKYRLWAAYHKGENGVRKDPEEAKKWLAQLVDGAYLATFRPVNGFAPQTPREFLANFNENSPLRSEPDGLGGASFFRTRAKDGVLIGAFLTAYPEKMRQAIADNPSLELISIKKVTPEMFVRYEASPQESLPADEQNEDARPKPPAKSREGSAPDELKYDDGKPDGKRSFGGSGEMIQFSLPGEKGRVKGIRIHGSRYGLPQPPAEDFLIHFLSEDGSEILFTETAPYKLFQRGKEKWVDVNFKKVLDVPKTFWIVLDFKAHQTKGVYVSFDSSTGGKHSKVGLPGGSAEPENVDFGGDWMVRVKLAGVKQNASAGGEPQVLVHVKIIEASIAKLKLRGFDPNNLFGHRNAIPDTSGGSRAFSVVDGSEAWKTIETLRKDELVKVLAEPTIAAVSGKTAVFRSGPEVSLPKKQPDGSVTIERQAGNEFQVTPEAVGERMRLALRFHVSELDQLHTVRVGDQTLPGVRALDFSTGAELSDGETLVLSGPIQTRMERAEGTVPIVRETHPVGESLKPAAEKRIEVLVLVLVRLEIVEPPAMRRITAPRPTPLSSARRSTLPRLPWAVVCSGRTRA